MTASENSYKKTPSPITNEIEVFQIPTPEDPVADYQMIDSWTIDEMTFRDFELLIHRLFIHKNYKTIKKFRKHVTHLKRAYLEHILTEIAIRKIKNASLRNDLHR